MLAGECGICATTVFDTEGYRSRVAAEVDIDAVDRRIDAARAAAPIAAAIGSACARRPRRSRDAGLLDSPIDRSRVGVFFGAGTADLLRNEDFYRTWITARTRSARDRRTPGIIFPARRSTSIAERFGFEGPRACVVAGMLVEHDRDRRAASKRFAGGRADAVLAGGTDALSRLTFSGFNLLRLMDPAPCRPVRSQPRRA